MADGVLLLIASFLTAACYMQKAPSFRFAKTTPLFCLLACAFAVCFVSNYCLMCAKTTPLFYKLGDVFAACFISNLFKNQQYQLNG